MPDKRSRLRSGGAALPRPHPGAAIVGMSVIAHCVNLAAPQMARGSKRLPALRARAAWRHLLTGAFDASAGDARPAGDPGKYMGRRAEEEERMRVSATSAGPLNQQPSRRQGPLV